MAEYIDREALFKRLKEETHDYDAVGKYKEGIIKGLNIAKSIVNDKARTPTADVVEVVYCKDCVCFKQSISALFPETNCFICDNPYGLKRNIKETDYCSCGERRCEE